jgi:NTE family protein
MIRNLAIKGGGVRGIAFVGALKELNAANILPAIERVSGTSAGAMLAAMISAGYDVEEIDRQMQTRDFK